MRARVLRFWNSEVLGNMDGVWQVIVAEGNREVSCGGTPIPTFPHKGGRGSFSKWRRRQ